MTFEKWYAKVTKLLGYAPLEERARRVFEAGIPPEEAHGFFS